MVRFIKGIKILMQNSNLMIKEFLPLIKKVLWKVMKANGLIENFMVRVFLNGKMDQFMKDNIKMDKKRP